MSEPGEPAATPEDLIGLMGDVAEAQRDLDAGDNPFRRRSYVRTVFAAVEGAVHELKLRALQGDGAHPLFFSPGELSFIHEEAYSLDDRGNVRVQPRFVPAASNVLFAFKAYMRSKGCEAALNLDHEGWPAFRGAIAIRNRITHPKRPQDLVLSDEDLHTVDLGYRWFTALLARNLLNAVEFLEARTKALKEKHHDA